MLPYKYRREKSGKSSLLRVPGRGTTSDTPENPRHKEESDAPENPLKHPPDDACRTTGSRRGFHSQVLSVLGSWDRGRLLPSTDNRSHTRRGCWRGTGLGGNARLRLASSGGRGWGPGSNGHWGGCRHDIRRDVDRTWLRRRFREQGPPLPHPQPPGRPRSGEQSLLS